MSRNTTPRNTLRHLIATTALITASALAAAPAAAHGYHGHRHHHGGGWWGPALGVGLVLGSAAIVANAYSPPPRPVVLMPPPTVVTPQVANVWYFCADTNSYYPQTQTCPSGWRVVPASPPPGY